MKFLILVLLVISCYGNGLEGFLNKKEDINIDGKKVEVISKEKSKEQEESDKYIEKVFKILNGWEKEGDGKGNNGDNVKVKIFISPDGVFDYAVTKTSPNKIFEKSITDFLDKQKKIKYPSIENTKIIIDMDYGVEEIKENGICRTRAITRALDRMKDIEVSGSIYYGYDYIKSK